MSAAVESGRPGHGRRTPREAPRFVRGRGTYVNDIQLPGTLHLAVLRAPVATPGSRPSTSPLRRRTRSGLAWMPTLSADTQAVLVTDKVRFQGQEVAFVVAEDRHAARDALNQWLYSQADVTTSLIVMMTVRYAAGSTPR